MKKNLLSVILFSLFSTSVFSQAWSNVGNSYVCASGVNQLVKFNNNIFASGVPQITNWNNATWQNFAYVSSPDKIWSVTVYQNEIYVCGEFSFIGTIAASNIAKFNGTTWSAVGAGLSAGVSNMAVYNGELYAFGIYGDSIFNNSSMAKWNGTTWSSLPGNNYFNGYVSDFAVFQNELVVAGYFYSMGGVSAYNIAKFNGTTWSGLGSGANYITNILTVHNNELYVGGYFSSAGGIAASCIAKWNGSVWSALGNGVGGYDHAGGVPAVHGLAFYDGNLYAGGQFTTVGTGTGSDLALWDGNNWYNVGTHGGGNCGGVYALGVFDNDLWVAGLFDTAGTIAANNIARYTIIAGIDENISSADAAVYPNPAKDNITVEMVNRQLSMVSLTIYNSLGEKIYFSEEKNVAGKFSREIPLKDLDAGIYFMKIETGTETVSKKFVIER